jgi:hypothetical protein
MRPGKRLQHPLLTVALDERDQFREQKLASGVSI